MASRSMRKGKGFEREVAKIINDKFGLKGTSGEVRRTPGSGNLDIKGDLRGLSGRMSDFVIECKKQESLNIWKCLEQSRQQAGSKMEMLVFSRNNTRTYAAMQLEDLLNVIKELEDLAELRGEK